MSQAPPHARISHAIRAANDGGQVGLVPFITAGYPEKDRFIDTLRVIASAGDVVEIGVPFSDPMADGVTIQRSSRAAIEGGVNLHWIIDQLRAARAAGEELAPLVLMSYLNPLFIYGYEQLAGDAAEAGVCGFIVPDLPLEEGAEFRAALDDHGLAQIQLVTPTTPDARVAELCRVSKGFVYAVTVTGTTGGGMSFPPEVTGYLDQLRATATIPVCAGFGIREAAQVRMIGQHADGVIVGSALVEQLEAGEDPAKFLQDLRE
ncbi:MAG: tryptophan synthase subunit alpha [Gammaproteobacteria bacterium]|nr:tryptophan synthase subunit alpha [Gammaproteobacteria bacterium]